MKEVEQAAKFYLTLSPEERNDLAKSIASEIFFYDDELQTRIGRLLEDVNEELWKNIVKINNFTM